jgi:pimeloyl-ACP methyl ester carboxylesterase
LCTGQCAASNQIRSSQGANCAILFLHGKGGDPQAEFLTDFYSDMAGHGYSVKAPVMPWSRLKREGTLDDAFTVIDIAAAELHKQHDKVFLAGHSMGAVVALIYAGRTTVINTQGVIAIAAAHIPRMSPVLTEITKASVEKARKLASQGKNKERHRFLDLNNGRSYEMESTVEHYLSFYDPVSFPDINQVLAAIMQPALWISGKADRLTGVYAHESLYRRISANDENRYLLLAGGHKSVLDHTAAVIATWLKETQDCI